MKRTFGALVFALCLSACSNAATVTIIGRPNGPSGTGAVGSNFTGTGGDIALNMNGKIYKGRWVGERSMGFAVTSGTVGSSSLLASSAFSGGGPSVGSALLRSDDGEVMRCEFRYSEWSATGSGVCVDSAGRLYDFQAE